MKKARMYRIIIVIILAVAVFVVFLFKLFNSATKAHKAFDEDLPATFSLTGQDSVLFSGNALEKMKILEVRNSKVRNPITVARFDEQYYLIFYRIDLSQERTLQELLQVKGESEDQSTGVVYSTIAHPQYYKFKYRSGKIPPAQQIFLTLEGDAIIPAINSNNMIGFELSSKNLSIRYGAKEPVDIFISGDEMLLGRTVDIPMQIIFLKRNGSVYFLILTTDDPKKTLPAGILKGMINAY